MSARYVVRVVTGDLQGGAGGRGKGKPFGLSAVVLDSAVCYRRMAELRSEDGIGNRGARRGREGATKDAIDAAKVVAVFRAAYKSMVAS